MLPIAHPGSMFCV